MGAAGGSAVTVLGELRLHHDGRVTLGGRDFRQVVLNWAAATDTSVRVDEAGITPESWVRITLELEASP